MLQSIHEITGWRYKHTLFNRVWAVKNLKHVDMVQMKQYV